MADDILSFRSEHKGVVTARKTSEDQAPDMVSLRPERFDDYIGQTATVETLKIAIQAARLRNESLDHILLHGPPGLGKTTLCHIIANEMEQEVTVTSGPTLEKGGDLMGILTHLSDGEFLFIDEIHRIPKVVEEFLYPAMEDYAVDFVFDKGIHARSHRYRLKRFVLVGATTRVGLLSSPLRDRFGLFRTLDFYTPEELVVIIQRSAQLLNTRISENAALALADRSRGTPRIANRLLKRVRDFAQVRADGRVTREVVQAAWHWKGIDRLGLTRLDRSYLETIIDFITEGRWDRSHCRHPSGGNRHPGGCGGAVSTENRAGAAYVQRQESL